MTPMGEMPSFDAIRESISTRRADRLEFENANLREALENERKFSAATKARVAELEAENKNLSNRAELADGDVKKAQAILDASNTYIRRIEVELQSESQAKIDAEFHVAALKERLAELEARCKLLELAGDNLDLSIACGCGVDAPCQMCRRASDSWKQAKEAKP